MLTVIFLHLSFLVAGAGASGGILHVGPMQMKQNVNVQLALEAVLKWSVPGISLQALKQGGFWDVASHVTCKCIVSACLWTAAINSKEAGQTELEP